MVEPYLKKLASQWRCSAAGGDTARLELYQAILDMGRAGDEEAGTSTSRAFERQKGAILPVLVKGKDLKTRTKLVGAVPLCLATLCVSSACACACGAWRASHKNTEFVLEALWNLDLEFGFSNSLLLEHVC